MTSGNSRTIYQFAQKYARKGHSRSPTGMCMLHFSMAVSSMQSFHLSENVAHFPVVSLEEFHFKMLTYLVRGVSINKSTFN